MASDQSTRVETAPCMVPNPCDVVEACEDSKPLGARLAGFLKAVLWATAAAYAAKGLQVLVKVWMKD